MKTGEILEDLIRIKNDIENLISSLEHLEEKGERVRFEDQAIEDAVREAIGQEEGDLYSREIQDIEKLDVRNKKVKSLEGLQHLVNLKVLNLNWNQIQDISPLAGLYSLEHLKLWGNQISDISPLSRLSRLEVLTLEDNRITDIESLAGLDRLQMLWLRKNNIRNLEPLLENQGLKVGSKVFLNGDLFTFDSDTEIGQAIEELMARGVIIYT